MAKRADEFHLVHALLDQSHPTVAPQTINKTCLLLSAVLQHHAVESLLEVVHLLLGERALALLLPQVVELRTRRAGVRRGR